MHTPLPATLETKRALLSVFYDVVERDYPNIVHAEQWEPEDADALNPDDVRCDLDSALCVACDILGLDYEASMSDAHDIICAHWVRLTDYLIRTTDRY